MLNAGDLTRKITIERDEVTQASGAEKRTPAVYASIWSRPRPLNGREIAHAQELDSRINYAFDIRYRTDLKASDRVILGSRRWEIKAVLMDEDRRESGVLLCEAKT